MARTPHNDRQAEEYFNTYDVTKRGYMNIEGIAQDGADRMRTPVDPDNIELEEFRQRQRLKYR